MNDIPSRMNSIVLKNVPSRIQLFIDIHYYIYIFLSLLLINSEMIVLKLYFIFHINYILPNHYT